jgi:hypothetical protein
VTDSGDAAGESLEAFKNSFSYGSRTDLSFKFLKNLTPDEAGEFFRQLLHEVGESFDAGDLAPIHRLVYEWQVRAYTPAPDAARTYVYDDGPFAPLGKPLAGSRVGLVSSSGHFVTGDDPRPFGVDDMTQAEAVERISEFLRATPELSEIPAHTPRSDLTVRHGGYDIRSVARDPNVAFPLELMLEAESEGRIGEVGPRAFSFVGATAQGRLRRQAIPEWVDRFEADRLDVLLLVPV